MSGEGHSRQKNNTCAALKWTWEVVPRGWESSECGGVEQDEAGELVGPLPFLDIN